MTANAQTATEAGDQPVRMAAKDSKIAAGYAQTTSALALTDTHMPSDFSISLDALRRGGTDRFLRQPPSEAKRQAMAGFEDTYVNIVDYIVRITHRIWEEKDIGYIYDTYSHDCKV